MLEVGSKAIDFCLKDQDDRDVRLSSFKGQKVILYFYPKDNTPGCTKEACAFKNNYEDYSGLNAIVLGISKDSRKSHFNFSQKYELPFRLLSDPDHKVIEAYDVWKEKKLYGKASMGIVRSTYVIDEEGVIIYAKEKVKPEESPVDVLSFLKGQE